MLPSSTILSLSLSIQSIGMWLFVATGLRFVKKCVFRLKDSGSTDAPWPGSRVAIVIGTHIKSARPDTAIEFNSRPIN
ncbi:hypothetical protein RCF34_03550 [Pseudomonas sp. 102515]|uniref:hypothetical protein n=1 Tax=Pseudomonas sp. 102515 TaxID=3071568 RepID=UPI0028030D4E|nr:hypothetical protein [Pseudomonas sp. 102515]MDQ7912183.1 hypothetical protein [Pseudomonas sp. 102515]